MPRHITVRQDDTEPLIIPVGARGVGDLENLSTAELYLWPEGSPGSKVVDAHALSVHDSEAMLLAFDPDGAKVGGGNPLDTVQTIVGYVKLTWSDNDTTRHPQDQNLKITVKAHNE